MAKKKVGKRQIPWGPIALISFLLAMLLGPIGIVFTIIFVISFSIWGIGPFVDVANKKRKFSLDLLPRIFIIIAVFSQMSYLLWPFIIAAINGVDVETIQDSCAGYLWGEHRADFCDLLLWQPYIGMFSMLNVVLFFITGAIWAIKDWAGRMKSRTPR
jgi:hypothetical protein